MITSAHIISGQDADGGSSATTASISPTASALVILSVWNWKAASTAEEPTVTGAGMTWTKIGTRASSSDAAVRCTLFRALSASPGSGALTISCATGHNLITWSVDEFYGIKTSGTNGADAVVQSAGNDNKTTATTLVVTLSAFGSTNNATFGSIFHFGSNAMTVGSGFTQLFQSSSNGFYGTEFKNSNDTSVDWTWGSENVSSVAMAVEISMAIPTIGGAFLFNMI